MNIAIKQYQPVKDLSVKPSTIHNISDNDSYDSFDDGSEEESDTFNILPLFLRKRESLNPSELLTKVIYNYSDYYQKYIYLYIEIKKI